PQEPGGLFWTKDDGTICYRQGGCQRKQPNLPASSPATTTRVLPMGSGRRSRLARDLLHDRDGALAHERNGRRMGGHRVPSRFSLRGCIRDYAIGPSQASRGAGNRVMLPPTTATDLEGTMPSVPREYSHLRVLLGTLQG